MTMYNNNELNESDHNEANLKEKKPHTQLTIWILYYSKMIAELAVKN
jgi:hypothetical protein